jgi:hypothetical protein
MRKTCRKLSTLYCPYRRDDDPRLVRAPVPHARSGNIQSRTVEAVRWRIQGMMALDDDARASSRSTT